MNFLPRAFEPLRDALVAMPVASRMIAAVLVVIVAIGMGLLIKGDSGGLELLFGGRSLSESEVDAVEMAFSQAGLRSWVREGRRIRVPSGARSDYLAALREASTLPLELRSSVQEAIDKASPWESSDLRISREMHAKTMDLGAKISAFPEIRWASVEYDRGERTGLSRTRPQSASVIVSPEGTQPLTKERIDMIKEFVRRAYAGMTSEEVGVTDTNASYASGHGSDEDPMLRKRREEETAYEQKVLRALVGYGPIRVAAHAELDPTMGVEKATLKYDSQRASLPRIPKKIDPLSARQVARGVHTVGPDAIGNRATSLDAPQPTDGEPQDQREAADMIGQQYELSKLASLQVRRVRISVGLPTSYYDKILVRDYLRENTGKALADMPPPSVEMLQQKRSETEDKIKAAVAQLLPLAPAGEDPHPLVHVWDYPDLPEPPLVTRGTPSQVLTWLSQSWRTLAILALALTTLLIARSALRGSGGASPAGLPQSHPAGDPEDERMTNRSEPSEDELQRMVEKNPEVAADVLRCWIAEAA